MIFVGIIKGFSCQDLRMFLEYFVCFYNVFLGDFYKFRINSARFLLERWISVATPIPLISFHFAFLFHIFLCLPLLSFSFLYLHHVFKFNSSNQDNKT